MNDKNHVIPCVERSGAAIKLKIIRLVEQAPPGKRKKDIAAKLSVPESTLSTVLQEKTSLMRDGRTSRSTKSGINRAGEQRGLM